MYYDIFQCFSTARPRPGIGPWHHLYGAARGSPGICHFSFLSIFHEQIFYSGNILRRIIFVNVSKISDPELLNTYVSLMYELKKIWKGICE